MCLTHTPRYIHTHIHYILHENSMSVSFAALFQHSSLSMVLFWVPVGSMIFIQRLMFLGNVPGRLSLEAWVENKVCLSGGVCLPLPGAWKHYLLWVRWKVMYTSACLGHRSGLKRAGIGTVWMESSVGVFFFYCTLWGYSILGRCPDFGLGSNQVSSSVLFLKLQSSGG